MLEGFQIASINGLILDKWLELGGPNSDLGFPIADEATTADGVGRFSTFQHGAIYWYPETGAHPVIGAIYEIWKDEGAESSEFGYPTSSPEKYTEKMATQNFENGELAANLYPNPVEIITEFLPFDSLEEARDYFERGSSTVSASRDSGIIPEGSLNCESWSQHFHKRTKSDNRGVRPPKVGFKPTLNCYTPKPPEYVKAHGWIYYDYWGRWDQAAYATQEFEKKTGSLQQTNLEVGCAGKTNTLFWGTSYIEIMYEGQPYWGQSAPNADFLECTIDRR